VERADENRKKMQAIGGTDTDLKRRWAIRADEQLVCIDAATGKTLWTVDWPGEGINLSGSGRVGRSVELPDRVRGRWLGLFSRELFVLPGHA